ncbi:DUF6461 domain-containing protein [Lentzea sp. DG1S-22]|uniref:DUF6461 domain-containing protein n=1 Tax=Lentzea sp. DG1S-22 TaxID=3108822 RepID=UPI002E786E4D|nr:DUF6461 domain-containing protein [Lentzea sp. DG1S-22]WVH84246.1 DUF6461 domain-containing protein [Lentzea sp. DG1S-22]
MSVTHRAGDHVDQHDLSWADADPGPGPFLGEIFTLVFVRDLDPLEALRRAGGLMDTLEPRTPAQMRRLHDFDYGYPEVAAALPLGGWTVLSQPASSSLEFLADALSRGTEAVVVTRHDYASPGFVHHVDGELAAHFNPTWLDESGGDGLERLLPLMREAGFDTGPADEDDDRYDEPITRSLRPAGLLTGVLPTFDQLTAPLPSAHFERWFTRTRPEVVDNPLATATEIVAELSLEDTPGLAAALTAARRGDPVVLTPDSDLGRHVREWSALSRRAGWSLNHARSRMTDEERAIGHRHGHLLHALAAAFRADRA